MTPPYEYVELFIVYLISINDLVQSKCISLLDISQYE